MRRFGLTHIMVCAAAALFAVPEGNSEELLAMHGSQDQQKGAHLRQIRLEPAPGPKEAPNRTIYDFVAPLDADGFIDLDAWKRERPLCFVHRIEDGDVVHGQLVHRPGGAGGATWAFDYDPGQGDEETGFRFDAHAFTPGAYVTVRDADGDLHTYRVTAVKPV